MVGERGRVDIDYRASLARYRQDLREAERITQRAANNMQRSTDRANQRLSRFGVGLRGNMEGVERQARGVNTQLDRMGTLLAAIGGVAAARAIVDLADDYTNLSARIRLVLRDGEDFADVQDRIFQAAQRSRAPISDLTTLYVRLRQSIAGLGDVEALNISETLARTLTISGASATEAAGFLRQISQALASGVLRGDEFNSVMENNSRFARLLADHLGVSVGELRKMAEEGRLTADIIRGAVAGGAAQINNEFERMPLTIGSAMTQLRNAMARYVGETDQGLGASRRMAEGLAALARNFETVAEAALLVGGAFGVAFLGRGAQAAARTSAREMRRWDAPYRARRFGMQRQRLEAAGIVANGADATAAREAQIANLEAQIKKEREAVAAIRAAQARRMFNVDGAEIDRALREGRAPILRPMTQAQGPVPIPGAVRGGQAAEADNLAAAQQRLVNAEKELQQVRGQNYRASMQDIQARNRLTWATAQIREQNSLWAQSLRGVQAAGVGVGRFFGSLFNFLGGPWGVALAAAAGAWMLFRSEQDKAAASAARMQDALNIIASFEPAADGAASALSDVAAITDEARSATDRLAQSQRDAAGATRDQAEATRALAEMRRRDALATMQQALADQRRALHRQENYTFMEGVTDFFTGEFIGDRAGRKNPGEEAIGQTRSFIAMLERGIAQLERGEVRLGLGAAPPPSIASPADMPTRADAVEDRAALMRELSILERQWEIEVLRARELDNIADAKQDILDIDTRSAELMERFGVSEEEATRRAREYVTAMREAANAARDRARAEDELDRALQIAEAEGHYRRSDDLRRQADISRGSDRYRSLGYDNDTAAAMARRDADQLRAATARGELRMAFEQALFAAATGGDWKEALANSLRQAAEAGFARAIDFIYDLLFSAVSQAFAANGGGKQSFIGQVAGFLLTGSTGSGSSGGGSSAPRSGSVQTRANGGNVSAGEIYKVGEIGPELFMPGQSGKVITNRDMRNAMSANAGSRQKVELVVDARTDGSVLLRIAEAEQRATVNGAAMGARMVGKGMSQRQSK